MPDKLGEFEQQVLWAVLRLEPEAYGLEIRRTIEKFTARPVNSGAVYTTLERLERRGLVSSYMGEPTAERGGRRKRFIIMEPLGAQLLQESRDRMLRMASGLERRLRTLVEEA